MPFDFETYRSAAMSHAQSMGLFGQVLDHEPVSAPGSGLTYAVWLGRIVPVGSASGLASVSVRVELMGRVYMPADSEPLGSVDVAVGGAANSLMAAYAGDFEFGGSVRNVDIFGAHGTPLQAPLGYTRLDSTTYRVATLTIPLIVNDVWTEAP